MVDCWLLPVLLPVVDVELLLLEQEEGEEVEDDNDVEDEDVEDDEVEDVEVLLLLDCD